MNNFRVEISAITNKGSYRKHNQDNFFINDSFLSFSQADNGTTLNKIPAFPVVAGISDGMGGENAGEEASLIVASNIFKCILKSNIYNISEKLRKCIKEINKKVCENVPGSGATLAMIYADGKKITAASIGDSRIYLYKNGILRQMSTDHTLAQMQAEAGLMSKEQAKESKLRHVLTQHIGISPLEMVIDPDVFEIENFSSDDAILICSDGFTDSAEEKDVENIFSLNCNASSAAAKLMAFALSKEKKDNITVMVIKATGG